MSEIQKCPNLVSIFQKCLTFKNVPKVGGGGEGGSTLIGTLSQIFLIFYFDTSPNLKQRGPKKGRQSQIEETLEMKTGAKMEMCQKEDNSKS